VTEPATRGHVFIVDGDLNSMSCDAVLIPSSSGMNFSNDNWLVRVPEPESTRLRTKRARAADPAWKVVRDEERDGTVVWIGNVGLDLPDPGPYVEVAEQFIRRAYGELPAKGVVPRLALNLLGSGQRGMKGNKGDLVIALVGKLLELADELPVDIILITRGLPMYAACQITRRRLAPPRPLVDLVRSPDPDRLEKVVVSIAQNARARQLVLFVGAGVSMGAGLPGWQGLLDSLASEARDDKRGELDVSRLQLLDVRDQAQVISRRLGLDAFRLRLKAKVSVANHALAHGLLASLDPHEVVTTNYDTLMERAFGEGRTPAVLPYSPVGPGGRWVLKLHGTIEEEASMVLTRTDYLGLVERTQALFGVVQAMLMNREMLFIGYSLSDDSFHRVVHEVRRARAQETEGGSAKKFGTGLTLFKDPVLEELWGEDLDIVPMCPARRNKADDNELAAASRQLDIVLDRIAQEAADVSTFLLDETYETLLIDEHDKKVKRGVQHLMSLLDGAKPIDQQLHRLLAPLTP
jgi:hypothetical protein